MNIFKRRNVVVVVCMGLLGVILVGAGCVQSNIGTRQDGDEQKLHVAATFYPVYDLVRTVGGDNVQVELIVPPGVSEHYFDPTPGTIKSLQGVEAIFAIGHNLDGWAETLAKNTTNATVVTLDKNIKLMTGDAHIHDEHEHEEDAHEEEHYAEEGADPHYWLDPRNAMTMAENIADELSRIDPEREALYHERADAFVAELEQKDFEWQMRLAVLPRKHIVTFHDAFQYFANRYDLEVVATFEPFPGKEPTPQYLARIEKEIAEHDVNVLFLEPQLSEETLRTFAEDHGIVLGTLDPLGGLEDRLTYIDLMEYNVKSVERALE